MSFPPSRQPRGNLDGLAVAVECLSEWWVRRTGERGGGRAMHVSSAPVHKVTTTVGPSVKALPRTPATASDPAQSPAKAPPP